MSNIEYLRELHHKKMNLKRAQFRVKELGVFHANQISMCLDPHLN